MDTITISENECYCGLRLIKLICDNIIMHGDVPEHVLNLAERIRNDVEPLNLQAKGADYDAMGALIVSGFVPTFAKSPRGDCGSAIIDLIETRGVEQDT